MFLIDGKRRKLIILQHQLIKFQKSEKFSRWPKNVQKIKNYLIFQEITRQKFSWKSQLTDTPLKNPQKKIFLYCGWKSLKVIFWFFNNFLISIKKDFVNHFFKFFFLSDMNSKIAKKKSLKDIIDFFSHKKIFQTKSWDFSGFPYFVNR